MKTRYGVYIHIPFCQAKCFYCDFYSTDKKGSLTTEYVKAAATEIASLAQLVRGRTAATIFIGGGTPSLLTEEMTAILLDACAAHLKLAENLEVTLEANPETLTVKRAEGYLRSGVNRLSIGVQSLRDDMLKALGRIHSAKKARKAVEVAREAGFKNISADMMFALPGQSPRMWLEDLEEAAALDLEHLSCYQLTPEPGTLLGAMVSKGETSLPEETLDYFDETEKLLAREGYAHYEISNYARDGGECAHNLGYWEYHDYLGVGSAAHGMVDGVRWANARDPARYAGRVKATGRGEFHSETLTDAKKRMERLMMGLRMKKGMALHGMELTAPIERMIREDMLRISRGRLAATPKGWRVLNSVLEEI
jgi:oxygen-independent coproporphyrinogen-3 oxidase